MIVSSTPRLLFALCALAALPFALSACDTMDDETVQESPPPQNVQQTPPEPEVEMIPMISDPQNEIWRPGYWAFNGVTFSWISGKIIPRPSTTAVWTPARWTQHNYGWSFELGHWQ